MREVEEVVVEVSSIVAIEEAETKFSFFLDLKLYLPFFL